MTAIEHSRKRKEQAAEETKQAATRTRQDEYAQGRTLEQRMEQRTEQRMEQRTEQRKLFFPYCHIHQGITVIHVECDLPSRQF